MKTDEGICFENQFALGADGWAMLAPYGEFPGVCRKLNANGGVEKREALQVVDRAAADELVNQFRSLRSRFSGFFCGVPLYIGHPDALGETGPRESVGTIVDLEARGDAIYCRPVFTNGALHYLEQIKGVGLSPRWEAVPAGEREGKILMRPCRLHSAGLTNVPNLPVELLNHHESMSASIEINNRWVKLDDGRRVPIDEPELRGTRLRSYRRRLANRRKTSSEKRMKASAAASKSTAFEQALFQVQAYVKNRRIQAPECFISYAWGVPQQERWVEKQLTTDLQKVGIKVLLDRWHNAQIGASVPRFVELVRKSDRVVVVGTPLYREKYENRNPMRGYVVAAEGDLIGSRLIGTETEKLSVLPVLLAGTDKKSFPELLQGRVYADFRDAEAYFRTGFDLILSLYQIAPNDPAVTDLRESLAEDRSFWL